MKMEEKIKQKLTASLVPTILIVKNKSHLHQGHAGDDGSGESHFHLEIQSHALSGLSRVAAQRAIYDALSAEIKHIHALSITVIPLNKTTK